MSHESHEHIQTEYSNPAILSHNCGDKPWVANWLLHTCFRSYRDSKGTKLNGGSANFHINPSFPTKPTGPLLTAAVWGSVLVRTVAIAHLTDARGSKGCFPCDWWFFHTSETEDSNEIFSNILKHQIWDWIDEGSRRNERKIKGGKKGHIAMTETGGIDLHEHHRWSLEVRRIYLRDLESGVHLSCLKTTNQCHDFHVVDVNKTPGTSNRRQIVGRDTPEWSCLVFSALKHLFTKKHVVYTCNHILTSHFSTYGKGKGMRIMWANKI